MVHLNITFPEELKVKLDREVGREKTKRSTLIQKAVRVYLELKKRKNMKQELREGYEALLDESLVLLDDFKNIDKESQQYVD